MMNRLFTTMIGNVGANIQDTTNPMQTVIKTYLNDIYFDLLKRVNFQDIDDDYSFPTVAGTQDYILPRNFGKEVYVLDSTNKIPLRPTTHQQLINDSPDSISTSGQPLQYLILTKPVRNSPSSLSTLSVYSESASDTSQAVRVKGLDTNGTQVEETLNLNGTTPQVSTYSYTEVLSITKSAISVGRVIVTANAGAVTVAVLAPADLAYFENVVRLHCVPNGVVTVKMPYIRRPYPLSNDYDQPIIDCADVLELGATMKAWRYKRQFQKASEYERQYERAIDTLVWDKENSFNQPHYTLPQAYPRNNY